MITNSNYLHSLIQLLTDEGVQFQISENCNTANYDLQNKIIELPEYVFNHNDILINERLICHEIAHAKYTDKDFYVKLQDKFPKDLVNLIEDIRIENIFKNNYIGCSKLFTIGFLRFLTLSKSSEIGINFLDKICIYFKSNYYLIQNFNLEELNIVNKLKNLYKEEDMIPILIEIMNYIKQNKEEEDYEKDFNKSSIKIELSEKSDNNNDDNNNEEGNKEEADTFDVNSLEADTFDVNSLEYGFKNDGELNNIIKKMIEDSSIKKEKVFNTNYNKSNELHILNPGKLLIIPENKLWNSLDSLVNFKMYNDSTIFESILKNVEILSCEFNRKKNAKNYRNIAKTNKGSLDLSKLGKVFTSVNIFSNDLKFNRQKNHEIIILLDWSSSILGIFYDLMIQACTIAYFCYKNNIKCTLYGFSNNQKLMRKFFFNDITYGSSDEIYKKYLDLSNSLHSINLFRKTSPFALMELINTNKTNNFKSKIEKLISLSKMLSSECVHNKPINFMHLSGTPLFESLLKIGPLLKSKSNSNKTINLICLTDGESDSLFNHKNNILDMQSKNLYKNLNLYNDSSCMNFLCNRLKSMISNLNITHIFVGHNASCLRNNSLISSSTLREKLQVELKKNRCINLKYEHFNSLVFLTDNTSQKYKNDLKLDNTMVTTKAASINILKNLNTSLSKEIYKKLADYIA